MSDTVLNHNAGELTQHIETRYHARHREQLPSLIRLVEMVEDLHEPDRDVPEGLTAILRRMIGEMEVPMKKKELMVFPLIRKGGGAPLAERIASIRADHDDRDRDLATVRRLTGDFTLPEGACTPWVTLYEGLAEFTCDLIEHTPRKRPAKTAGQFSSCRGVMSINGLVVMTHDPLVELVLEPVETVGLDEV